MSNFNVVTELLLNGVWTDITPDVFQGEAITVTRGRADQASTADPSSCALGLNNQTGKYSPRNPMGVHYGVIGRNTPLRTRLASAAQNYMALPGGATTLKEDGVSAATTPDAAVLDIVGDIDVRVDVEPCTWRPLHEFGLACKYVNSAANRITTGNIVSRSWRFWIDTNGYLVFSWNPSGGIAADITVSSTIPVPVTSGRLSVRVTLDVDLGGTDRRLFFYTAPTLGGAYTQLGAAVQTPGVTSINSGSADLDIGRAYAEIAGGSQQMLFQGKVYGAEVRSVIGGTVVASPDFTTLDVGGAAGLTDAQGRVWTMRGNATIANPTARFHGEVPAWPQRWDKTGRDIRTGVQAFGVARRLGKGYPSLRSTLYRALTSQPDMVAYWPAEDGDNATKLASAVPDGDPMNLYGVVELGSYDGFLASEPLPSTSSTQWTGTVPKYTSTGRTQAKFLMAIPAAGEVGGGGWNEVWRARAYGTAPLWVLSVSVGGSLRLQAFNEDNVQIHDSGAMAFGVNGKKLLVSVEFEHAGANINWTVSTLEVGQASGTSVNGTLLARTLGRVLRIGINTESFLADTAIGHISVHSGITNIADLSEQLGAFSGELATDRIMRLCREEAVPATVIGDSSDATRLGAQLPGQLLDLLRGAGDSDMGVLYEPREFLGLAYRTRASMYAQEADLTLAYDDETVSEMEPTEDDDEVHNDITVTREGGSSVRTELTTGTLSTLPPPLGVGRYEDGVSVSLRRDEDLPDQAGWRLHVGTVDEPRYPVLGLNLGAASFRSDAALTAAAMALDVGGRVLVTDAPMETTGPDDVQQLAQGFTETINPFVWLIGINCSPAAPWDVAVWDDTAGPGEARYSSDGSTLSAAALISGTALLLSGVSPGRASTPDVAALDIVGDIDIRVHAALDDWTPSATQTLVSKSLATGNQRSWQFSVNSTGNLVLVWSANGTATLTATSTAAPVVVNGAALWVRATLDVDNGAAGRDARFYTSTDGETWTQLGTTVTTATVTSIFNSSATVVVGAIDAGVSNRLAGKVSAVEIRNGIGGTVVARPEFGAQTVGTSSFADSTGKTWTITAPAAIASAAASLFPDTLFVSTPTGPVWSDTAVPYDICIGGERMTVTAVTGAGAAQVFTVTRSVNDVAKAHASGAAVGLFKPGIYAL